MNHEEPKACPAGMSLTLVAALQRRLPRGKGAIPRFLGRRLGKRPRYLITKHGAKLVMASGAYDVYATMALNDYSWEYDDFQACLLGLGDGQVFYDVGANVGYYTIEMANIRPTSHIIAFEPQLDLAEAIRASVNLNRFENVEVLPMLVGDRSRLSDLFLAPASIHASPLNDFGRRSNRHVQSKMAAIDELVASGEIPDPDFVKMDVEASEHLVLQGGAATFRRSRPHIYLEYLARCDVDLRVRKEVELLAADADYRLYGWPRKDLFTRLGRQYLALTGEDDWAQWYGIFMRQPDRPVQRPDAFRD